MRCGTNHAEVRSAQSKDPGFDGQGRFTPSPNASGRSATVNSRVLRLVFEPAAARGPALPFKAACGLTQRRNCPFMEPKV